MRTGAGMTAWSPLLVLLFATADSLATRGGGGRPSAVATHSRSRRRNGHAGSDRERAPLMMASKPPSPADGGEAPAGAADGRSPASAADDAPTASRTRGRAMLLLVAFLYGTLNVVLRAVYATEGPPAASVLSFARQCLSVLVFVPIFAFAPPSAPEGDGSEGKEDGGGDPGAGPLWLAALELAAWNVGAQGLLNAGVLFTQAARASFLTQMSVVITPLLSAVAGERVNRRVWAGCGLALGGLFLISTSGAGTAGEASVGAAADVLRGDTMVLGGALCWSMYIFRTSRIASSYDELRFQFAKNSLMALLYGAWAAWTAAAAISSAAASGAGGWSEALAPLWSGIASPWVWALLAYSAIGPGSVADILQQKGQKETSASESNIILVGAGVDKLLHRQFTNFRVKTRTFTVSRECVQLALRIGVPWRGVFLKRGRRWAFDSRRGCSGIQGVKTSEVLNVMTSSSWPCNIEGK